MHVIENILEGHLWYVQDSRLNGHVRSIYTGNTLPVLVTCIR